MKRSILTLVCLSLALCALADEPQYAIEDLLGAKIASFDAYDFTWNESTGAIDRIIESDYAMRGKSCSLILNSSTGKITLSGLYSGFSIPVDFDLAAGTLKIEVNKVLCRTKVQFEPASQADRLMGANTSRGSGDDYWTLYAMPLSWLMGNDTLDDIYGQLNDDGTITFNDDFAFMVKTEIDDEVSWGLSPIFRNLKLINPNGTHEFTYVWLSEENVGNSGPSGHGHGGLVPRNPGTKPITPRPSSGIIGVSANLEPNQETMVPSNHVFYVIRQTEEVRPVYMETVNDTTLMVYNLFGKGNRCYINIYDDGTISLPHQQIYNNGLGDVSYNESCTGSCHQNVFTWSRTNVSGSDYPRFLSNVLSFTEDSSFDVPMLPEISFNVLDTIVEFCATTTDFGDIEVILYMYDEEANGLIDVENPLSLPRLSESYWVSLAAEAYNPITGVCSDFVWDDFEVPALEVVMPGDVNGNGSVTIADVTALINYLLTDDPTGIWLENADVNANGSITIGDVTALINILLTN